MKALVVFTWIFINLIFFGMCGYMYLLWSQYWIYLEKETRSTQTSYDQQIYYYNRGYSFNDTSKLTNNNNNTNPMQVKRTKHYAVEEVTVIKNSKPRFPNIQGREFEADTRKYNCNENDSTTECDTKISEYKEKILKEFRRVTLDEGNILRPGNENRYNVKYEGPRENYMDKSNKQLICKLRKVRVDTLRKNDVSWSHFNLKYHLPRRSFFDTKNYNTCAIVASAGSLKNSGLGKIIDSHDIVLRFNHAPTSGFEDDVGSKTSMRLLNSQVVSRVEFEFLQSDLYRNITLVAWDPSNYSAPLREWLEKPEHNLFPNYVKYRTTFPRSRFFLIDPRSLWNVWNFLQGNSLGRLRRNPPSSGFLGLTLLLPICNYVDMFEYIPSTRVTKKCHYYDKEDNLACTFGVWHPLAAEKLVAYQMNSADDRTVFKRGYIRIEGYRKVRC